MESVVARAESRMTKAEARVDVRWDEVVTSVHRQMRSLVGPVSELEDLSQVALEQVLKSIDRFERRSEFSTFTYGVCANVALRHFRSWRRFFRRFDLDRADATDVTAASSPDASDLMVESERVRRLYRALERISAKKRITLILADLEELPASEVSAILGVPEPTVRSRLRSARIELHTLLRRDPLFAPSETP